MNRAGDHRFTSSAFASDQHRGACVGNAFNHVEYAKHSMIAADDVFEPVAQDRVAF